MFWHAISELVVFFFTRNMAYAMRIIDWSSDVCSSDLVWLARSDIEQARMRRNWTVLDGQLAAIAASHDLTMVTRGAGTFAGLSDLRVEDWFRPSAHRKRASFSATPDRTAAPAAGRVPMTLTRTRRRNRAGPQAQCRPRGPRHDP